MADEKTSPKVASEASRMVRDRSLTPEQRSVAASALSQAENQTADGSKQAAVEAGEDARVPSATDTRHPTPDTRVRIRFAPLDSPDEPDPTKPGERRARAQSPVVEVASGTYYRKFVAAEQPFEVTGTSHFEPDGHGGDRTVIDITPEEELRILLADGNFVVDE